MNSSQSPERLPLTSPDLATERLARLRELLPGAFAEGRLVPEKLAALVGAAALSATPERYGLSYAGRAEALREMLAPSPGTLRPDREKSVAWDATENLILEGDNLHVLKLLQSAYAGAVKLIYIDPPYNTGNDFVYPDDFRAGVRHYKELTQQTLSTNAETSGRYHSDWLKMMHPRLVLARNLLRDDGVIFVSIDDHEVHNLRLLMDEVFGEENFVAQVIWEKSRKNDAKFFSVGHEYLLVYARSKDHLREKNTMWREEKPGAREIWEKYLELRKAIGANDEAISQSLKEWFAELPKSHPAKKWSRYSRVDKNGPWRDRDISWPGGDGPRYDVFHPVTKQACAVPEAGWRYSKREDMDAMIKAGLVEFRSDHTEPPFRKAHIKPIPEELGAEDEEDNEGEEFATQVRGSYFYKQAQVAVKYLKQLLGPKVFNNPKDHDELAKLFRYATSDDKEALILDFFAGSGTTGQAVLELNRQDGGNRKFILVQFPEPTGRADFPTIADITRERVRRVIQKLNAEDAEIAKKAKAELPLSATFALKKSIPGFRAYRLDDSNFKLWDADAAPADAAALAKQLELIAHNVLDGRGDEDVLAELLLKCGHPGVTLTSAVETREVAGAPVHLLAEGRLAICLSRALTPEVLRGIVALKPQRVLCLDVGFHGNDQLKTNTVLEMKTHGVQFQTV